MNPCEMLYHAILYITMQWEQSRDREWTLDILDSAQKAAQLEWEYKRAMGMLRDSSQRTR